MSCSAQPDVTTRRFMKPDSYPAARGAMEMVHTILIP